MYGRSDINRTDFKSEMTANAAKVIPMEKDPVLPTKIFPRELKKASESHTISGANKRIMFGPETDMIPITIIAGQIVSKPFSPPS